MLEQQSCEITAAALHELVVPQRLYKTAILLQSSLGVCRSVTSAR
jgi:hypothetical protein